MIVVLCFMMGTIKVFQDVMWLIFVMNFLGSITLAATFSMFKDSKALQVKNTGCIQAFKVVCLVFYPVVFLFAFVPTLSKIYGEKPVYTCEENLYPWVFPILMCFNLFITVLNLSTYRTHSKNLKQTIAEGGAENVAIARFT
jgi:hypothetical protein